MLMDSRYSELTVVLIDSLVFCSKMICQEEFTTSVFRVAKKHWHINTKVSEQLSVFRGVLEDFSNYLEC